MYSAIILQFGVVAVCEKLGILVLFARFVFAFLLASPFLCLSSAPMVCIHAWVLRKAMMSYCEVQTMKNKFLCDVFRGRLGHH